MKNSCLSVLFALALCFTFFSCDKKDDDPSPSKEQLEEKKKKEEEAKKKAEEEAKKKAEEEAKKKAEEEAKKKAEEEKKKKEEEEAKKKAEEEKKKKEELLKSLSSELEKGQKDIFAAIKVIHDAKLSSADLVKDYEASVKSHLSVDFFNLSNKAKVQEEMLAWLKGYGAVKEADSAAAQAGKAGWLGKRILNEKGLEYHQMVKKGLIGAYQMSNVLEQAGKLLLDPKAKPNEIYVNVVASLLGGYDYLDKEKVDVTSHGETFKAYPVAPGNEFMKYLNVIARNSNYSTIADDLIKNLKMAREHMIHPEMYSKHMLEAVSIAQKAVAIRAIYYMMKASETLDAGPLNEKAAHGISEGLGFVYSLPFSYNSQTSGAIFSKAEIDTFLGGLDLWKGQDAKAKLQEFSKEVSKRYGLDIAKIVQ